MNIEQTRYTAEIQKKEFEQQFTLTVIRELLDEQIKLERLTKLISSK